MTITDADRLLTLAIGWAGRLSPFSATLAGERQALEDESTLGLRVAQALNSEVAPI